jgi:hypothetical protein
MLLRIISTFVIRCSSFNIFLKLEQQITNVAIEIGCPSPDGSGYPFYAELVSASRDAETSSA